eukprot:gene5824-11753_t
MLRIFKIGFASIVTSGYKSKMEISVASMDRIHTFWFPVLEGESTPDFGACMKKWYSGGKQLDQYIRENFSSDYQAAARGELKEWESSPKGTLCLVILLDQFSRNMFRNNGGAFLTDDRALKICTSAIEQGLDSQLSPLERSVLYMPLMHSESLEVHDTLSVPKFAAIAEELPVLAGNHKYAIEHADIIRQWGRYPHRNLALGRESTPEEVEYLKNPPKFA